MSGLRRAADGMALVPPGGAAPFVAVSVPLSGAAGVLLPATAPGTATVAIVGESGPAPDGAALTILDAGAEHSLRSGGGERAVRRRLRRLRRTSSLLAAPLEPASYDLRPTQAVTLSGSEARSPWAVLAALLRASDRPLLIDVQDDELTVDELIAALDVGAAGAVIRTGDGDHDRDIGEALLAADAERRRQAPVASVVVCNHNGARYLDRCLSALAQLDYPDYEVILVDDGSSDDSIEIGQRHGVRIVALDKVGLSAARNAGLEAANGEWVAYIDGDTEAEANWLMRCWRVLDRLEADGVGGPNLPFVDAGWQERIVSGTPGQSKPIVEPSGSATMLAGCNMAFRRDSAREVGGFDERFPGAFDDIAFMALMIEAGKLLVVAPTASIFHHRRDTITSFIRQQYKWGLARKAFEARYAFPDDVRQPEAGLERAPLRPLPPPSTTVVGEVFAGPHAGGLWMLTNAPARLVLPLKLLVLLTVAAAVTAPIAAWADGWAIWALAFAAAFAALFGAVAASVPVCGAPRGPRGIAQRAATAALWFVQPLAYRLGDLRGRIAAGRA